ncbi:MAG: hypothetical protein COA81_00885 [Alphaproteobacteria bacterium]|nr:MAG: hypothetical protein COA81_00885 [Alphaproteobacteria bacterium]
MRTITRLPMMRLSDCAPVMKCSKNLGWKAPRGRGRPPVANPKARVTLRLDRDIIDYFKAKNPKGWQTRVNEALRKVAGLD